MKTGTILKCLFAAAMMILMSGCLTRRTVTQGGQTVSSEYVFKRPIKDAVQRSR